MTHRLLVAAALASGESRVVNPLDADDTRRTLEGIAALGIRARPGPGAWIVEGRGGAVPGGADVWLGESGTSFRFLTALAALGDRPSRLEGASRLAERPIAPLALALGALGGRVELPRSGSLPLRSGGVRPAGGRVRLPGGESSQYASALLLIGWRTRSGISVQLDPPVVSEAYVSLTLQALDVFGVPWSEEGPHHWTVFPGDARGREVRVEGDYSSASYFLAAPLLAGGRVRVTGLADRSRQPDAVLVELLERLGARVRRGPGWVEVAHESRPPAGFDFSVRGCPDLAPTLAALALVAEGPSRIRDAGHLRLKESDRLEALRDNLRRLGRPSRIEGDSLVVLERGRERLTGARIRTYGDHRLAMAFAVAGLAVEGLVVDDPDCVRKSNPSFWEQFGLLSGQGS